LIPVTQEYVPTPFLVTLSSRGRIMRRSSGVSDKKAMRVLPFIIVSKSDCERRGTVDLLTKKLE